MWTVMDSPIGELRLKAADGALTSIEFSPFADIDDLRADDDPVLAATRNQLAEYFAGRRRSFDLPLAARGTAFQQRVWTALQDIAWGETASYGELARRLAMVPGASRAVGLANGRNPIPIIVPCHRVIGADGSLTGYAGGLDRKKILLELESSALF